MAVTTSATTTSTTSSNTDEGSNYLGVQAPKVTGKDPILVYCGGKYSVQTSGTFIACCTSDPCFMPTTCISNTLTFADGKTQNCKGRNAVGCSTITVFPTYPAGNQIATSNIACYTNTEDVGTLYRKYEVTSSTTSSSTTSSSIMGSMPSPTSVSTGAPSNTQTNTNTSTPSESKAWIAGVVVGPVFSILLFLLVGFFLLRYRKKKKRELEIDRQKRQNETWAPQVYEAGYNNYQIHECYGSIPGPYEKSVERRIAVAELP